VASRSDIQAGAAFIELYVKESRLVKGLESAHQRLKGFGTSIAAVGGVMAGFGTSIVTALVGAAMEFAETGDALDEMASRTGVSTNALSELSYAASLSGLSAEELEGGLRKMQKAVGEASQGSKSAAESLARLHLSASEMAALAPEEQFLRVADALGAIEDPTEKATAAMDIFGKTGTAFLPLFADGAEGIRKVMAEARELGISMGPEQAKAASELADAWDRVKTVVKGTILAIGGAVGPMVTEALGMIKNVLVGVQQWVKDNAELARTLLKVGVGIAIAGAAVTALGMAIIGVGAVLGGIATIASTVATVVGAIFSPLGLAIAGVLALGGYLLYVSGAFGKIKEAASQFAADVSTAFQGVMDAIAAGDLSLAAGIAWAGLKVVYLQGMAWLNKLWQGAKWYFLATWQEAVTGLAKIFVGLMSYLKQAWAGFTGVLAAGFAKAEQLASLAKTNTARTLRLITDAEANAQRDAANSKYAAAIAGQGGDAERIRKEEQDTLAILEEDKQRYYDRLNADYERSLTDRQAAVDAARSELNDLTGQSAAKKKLADLKNEQDKGKGDVAAVGIASQGSFSAYAAALLGAGSWQDRLTKAAEETKKETTSGNVILSDIRRAVENPTVFA
jgi:hypothetical protein